MLTLEEILIGIIRIIGSIPTLKWAFFGSLFAVFVDLSDLFWKDYLHLGGIRNYQAFDKIFDLVYMSVFLIVARKWGGIFAKIALYLFIFRIIGMMLFEFTDRRFFLLIFPNIFEFWFIFTALARRLWAEKSQKVNFIVYSLVLCTFFKLIHEWVLHGGKYFDRWGFFEFMSLLFNFLRGSGWG